MVGTRLVPALSFLLTAVITAALLYRHDAGWSALLTTASPRLHLAALACVAIELLGRAGRMALLARGVTVPLTLAHATTVQLAADGAGAITPSRLGADPAKLFVLKRGGADLPSAGSILVGEAISESILLTVVAVLLALLVVPQGRVALGALSYAASTVLVIGFLLVASGRQRSFLLRRTPLPRRWRKQLRPALRRFTRATCQLANLQPRLSLGIALTTLLHMFARVALLPLLCIGIVSPDSIPELIAWAFTLLYGGALIPLPSAGGAIELGFTAALHDTIPAAELIPVLIWWRIYSYYLSALAGALVLTFTQRAR